MSETGNNPVKNSIFKLLGGKNCTPDDVASYDAVVRVAKCNEKCFTTIACGQETSFPEMTREAIRSNEVAECDLFAENGGLKWAEWTISNTAEMGEWSPSIYYSNAKFNYMFEWFKSGEQRIVLIDVNDNVRTQVGFRAYLTSFSAEFSESSSSDLTTVPATFQPTGELFVFEGLDTPVCK